jgi:hypothetical protein
LLLKYVCREFAASMDIPEDKPAKRKYERHAKSEAVEAVVDESAEEVVSAEEAPATPEAQLPSGNETLSADDLQQLVFALYVQAKAGISNTKEKLDQIKLIILA